MLKGGRAYSGDRGQPAIGKKEGRYRIFRLDIVRISGYYDLALESDSLESDQSYEERENEEFGEGI